LFTEHNTGNTRLNNPIFWMLEKCIYKHYNINFWRFAPYSDEAFLSKWRKVNTKDSLIGYPISLILRFFSK